MPALAQKRKLPKRKSAKVHKKDRPLTLKRQNVAAQFMPQAIKNVKGMMGNYPGWLKNLIGDQWVDAALLAACDAVNTHVKYKGAISTHLFQRCKHHLAKLTYETLRLHGAKPDCNNQATRSTIVSIADLQCDFQSPSIDISILKVPLRPLSHMLQSIKDERTRQILEMRFAKKLNNSEIGRRLGLSKETVRKQAMLGLRILKNNEQIKKDYESLDG